MRYLVFGVLVLFSNINIAETVLYGSFHGSLDFIDNGAKKSALEVTSNLSIVGIRGEEVISPGLTAIFQLENDIRFSSQDASELATCNTYVALGTHYGEFALGNLYTAIDDVLGEFNFFPGQLGDLNLITDPTGFAPCQPDSFGYSSPELGAFSFRFTYTPDEADSGHGDLFSISGFFGTENLLIGLGYERQAEDFTGGEDTQAFRLGASYTINSFTISGFYQFAENLTGLDDVDGNAYALSLAYERGANTFKFGYYATDNDEDDTNAQAFALGWDRSLSERTTIYSVIAAVDNEENTAAVGGPYSIVGGDHGGVGIATQADETEVGISFGIMHEF